ncbi:MAG: SoxR reducing system RseC family protein [Zoogloeaceae bacterium]|nr:SoxR reducing system RseC family protein [Zoogloeaceae bacterium]
MTGEEFHAAHRDDAPHERIMRLVALENDGYASVEPLDGGCGRCHEEGGCGDVHLAHLFARARRFRVKNETGARPGDTVIVVLPAGRLSRQATLAYVVPLLALIAGALAGDALAGEIGALAGGLLGLLLAWGALSRLARPSCPPPTPLPLGKTASEPYIAKILPQTGEKRCHLSAQ